MEDETMQEDQDKEEMNQGSIQEQEKTLEHNTSEVEQTKGEPNHCKLTTITRITISQPSSATEARPQHETRSQKRETRTRP